MTKSSPVSMIDRQSATLRSRARRAFTLVEIMIAGMVITLMTLAIMRMLVYSYKVNETIRYRDAARAMLVSFSDQFLRLAIATDDGTGTYVMKNLFAVEETPSGVGLSWNGVSGTAEGLKVKLGNAASGQIDAVVTRQIYYLDEITGVPDGSDATTAAGFMLKGVFTITYSYNGRNYVETFTLARLI